MTDKNLSTNVNLHFHAPCTYIEKQEIIVQAGAVFYNGPKPEDEPLGQEEDEALVDELLPLFYGEREEVAKFLRRIRGADGKSITEQVNMLVKARIISSASCYKPLYNILHKHHLYDKTYNNWLDQVKKLG